MNIYLDNAATTPMDPEVISEMTRVMQFHFGNPSSTHALGRITRTLIEDARKKVASLLHCSPGEIFFTSGGTEADNMAIRQAVNDLGIQHILTTPLEHHAVSHTIEVLEKEGRVKVHHIKFNKQGHIDLSDLECLLGEYNHALVCLMHANNELGTMANIQEIGELCLKYKALFQCDTVQTMGHFEFDLRKLPVHFLSAGAHKFNGPKGVGFIYVNHETQIHPMITGGSQERNLRGGTENLYGIAGLAKALEIAYQNLEEDRTYIQGLKSYMIACLQATIPGVKFNGDISEQSLFTVLNVSFPPVPFGEMILFKLDIAGICASGGSACSSGSNTGSHVLQAIGTDPDRPNVRFSFGKQNTKEEIDFVLEVLVKMFNQNTAAK